MGGQLISTRDPTKRAGPAVAPPPADAGVNPRIAFLFNAQAHQLLHGITVAEQLALDWQMEVDILSASASHLDLARRLTLPESHPLLGFHRIGSPLLHLLARVMGQAVPPKLLTLASAGRRLASYDAIAVPERTSTIIRKLGISRPRLIHLDHGAGDRAAGFDPRIALFDFALVAGAKQRRRLLAAGLIRAGCYATVGYAKFDAADRARDPDWFPFADRLPVILYNPHFSRRLGSWRSHGPEIVERLARDGRFNLIVAPHVRLCDNRRVRSRMEAMLAPYAAYPNVHVDLGSVHSIDMSYTMMADVYLGDVSSQVYEFLRTPKPCLFVNGDGRAWRDDPDHAHWHYGPVVDRADTIVAAVCDAIAGHGDYSEAQRRGFADTFDSADDRGGSVRAAAAIAGFLRARPRPARLCASADGHLYGLDDRAVRPPRADHPPG